MQLRTVIWTMYIYYCRDFHKLFEFFFHNREYCIHYSSWINPQTNDIYFLFLLKRLSLLDFCTLSILHPSAQMFWYNNKHGTLDIAVVRNATDSADLAYLLLHRDTGFHFRKINVFIQLLNSSTTNPFSFVFYTVLLLFY